MASVLLLLLALTQQHAAIQYLGHSCFVITSPAGTRLLIDPYADGEWPGLSFPTTHADKVLVTHGHWDHAAWRAIRGHPKVIDKPDLLNGKDFVIRGFAGRHADLAGGSTAYGNIIYVVETGGLRFCHLGDNGPVTEQLRLAIGPVDVLMVPVDKENRVLTYDQAQAWVEALSPRLVIPMHYRVPGRTLPSVIHLGTVDEWVSHQTRFERRKGDTIDLDPATLPQRGDRLVVVLGLPGEAPPEPGAEKAGRAEAIAAKNRGELAAAGGDLVTALTEFTRAADLDPADEGTLEKIGFLHLGSGRPDRALEYLRRANAWLGVGMALDLLGRRDEALAAYRKVVELAVNDDHQIDRAKLYLENPYTDN